jgi:membrane fusion protein, multidrug efflux system
MARINVRSRRFLIPAVLILLVVSLFAWRIVQAGAEREAAPTVEQLRAERGVPVTVATALSAPLVVWREYSGNVAGASEAVVTARTNDPITAVTVSAGARVSAGQVLVRQSGDASAARVRQATAALNQAQSLVNRLRPLQQAGAISDQEWEQAQTQLELAAADLAAARGVLALTSPLSGTVTDVPARPGMIPAPGDVLVRIADLSRIAVFLRVTAGEAAELRVGQLARTGFGAEGRIERVALQADPATRLVEVEIRFPPATGLIPGTLASVQIRVAERDQAVQVPRAAVRDGQVWVVDGDERAVRRAVQAGIESRDMIEVTSGILPGDRVVVEGGALLSEGAAVRIVNETGARTDV